MKFENLESIYKKNRRHLLESDAVRPCKSVTRDVIKPVETFLQFYEENKQEKFNKNDFLDIFNLTKDNDTLSTNIRVLREFSFIQSQSKDEYFLTDTFKMFFALGVPFESYLLTKLTSITNVRQITMYFNSLICTLREGVLRGGITVFPESNEDFIRLVPEPEKRLEYKSIVKEIYGFAGRYGDLNQEYTPNANYRVITTLQKLELIEKKEGESPFKEYLITPKGILILTMLNKNLTDEDEHDMDTDEHDMDTIVPLSNFQRIVHGAPGTGKSRKLEDERVMFGDNYERVTFHPDYTYSHFVGCYKPVSKEGVISYEFVPGPFIRILKQALENDTEPHLLLIEEINRSKVAAVFGDVFQLLDRNANGESEYGIAPSEELKAFLNKDADTPLLGNDELLKIPSNMYIWATMNSADQGVFPMDTAFRRRWDFEYIGIDEKEGTILEATFGKQWNALRHAINDRLVSQTGCRVNEDKLLGPFFIKIGHLNDSEKDKEKYNSLIREKVLAYLFDDAAKHSRSKIFKVEPMLYSEICKNFDREDIKGVFVEEIVKVYEERLTTNQQDTTPTQENQ